MGQRNRTVSLYSDLKVNDCYSCRVAIKSARSHRPDGVIVTLTDGPVSFIGDAIDLSTCELLGAIADESLIKLP